MAKGKVVHSEDACTVLVEGNKHVRPEPTTHVIQFPGGHMEVSRVGDDEYWAHIWVNKGEVNDYRHAQKKPGRIVASRIDRDYAEVDEIIAIEDVQHIAVRIRTDEVVEQPAG